MSFSFRLGDNKQILVVVQEQEGGYSYLIPQQWSVMAIENHLKELQEFMGA